jgi:hypothetical protein
MLNHHQFSVTETNHFIPSRYPQLEVNLQEIVSQLAAEPECKTDMLLSFVKNHCIDSKHVLAHPELARLISTGSLPLYIIEALFEAGKSSPPFKKELEEHIRGRFMSTDPGTHY